MLLIHEQPRESEGPEKGLAEMRGLRESQGEERRKGQPPASLRARHQRGEKWGRSGWRRDTARPKRTSKESKERKVNLKNKEG